MSKANKVASKARASQRARAKGRRPDLFTGTLPESIERAIEELWQTKVKALCPQTPFQHFRSALAMAWETVLKKHPELSQSEHEILFDTFLELAEFSRKGARKRLLKQRMYILPDGREFWYDMEYNNSGDLIGRVPGKDGQIIIHRSLLEQAELVPE